MYETMQYYHSDGYMPLVDDDTLDAAIVKFDGGIWDILFQLQQSRGNLRDYDDDMSIRKEFDEHIQNPDDTLLHDFRVLVKHHQRIRSYIDVDLAHDYHTDVSRLPMISKKMMDTLMGNVATCHRVFRLWILYNLYEASLFNVETDLTSDMILHALRDNNPFTTGVTRDYLTMLPVVLADVVITYLGLVERDLAMSRLTCLR
jgi:hypothetical protein